jgi:DNA-binding GntR family transcriptional regulator
MKPAGNLRLTIANSVRERIVAGQLAPGSRVNESRLSAELGVSRTPLREALFTVERLGIIDSDPQRGFFVAPLSAREVRELYPIGKALDALAVRSAGPVSDSILQRMRETNRAFVAHSKNAERARLADREFHLTLVSRCPNRRLLGLLDDVQIAMERYERLYMSDPSDIKRSARQHLAIIDALAADDLETAVAILGETWDYSARRLIAALGEPL